MLICAFALPKIYEVIKFSAIYDNALQDFNFFKISYVHFLIKDSIQRKKNNCFVRGGHEGLRGTIHIKNQLHNPVAVFEMNVFANNKIVLRIFQVANEARRKRAMVSIKTIFHYFLFSYKEKNPIHNHSH